MTADARTVRPGEPVTYHNAPETGPKADAKLVKLRRPPRVKLTPRYRYDLTPEECTDIIEALDDTISQLRETGDRRTRPEIKRLTALRLRFASYERCPDRSRS